MLSEKIIPLDKDEYWFKMSEDHHATLLRIVDDAYNPLHKLSVPYLQMIGGSVLSRTGAIHNTVLGITDESKGDFRLQSVHADGHYFMSYDKVYSAICQFVERVHDMTSQIKKSSDPVPLIVRLAIFCHFSILEIHPFSDGNGRTARLIMNYILLKYDLPLLIIDSDSKGQYIDTLRLCQTNKNMNPFISFSIREYLRSLKDYMD